MSTILSSPAPSVSSSVTAAQRKKLSEYQAAEVQRLQLPRCRKSRQLPKTVIQDSYPALRDVTNTQAHKALFIRKLRLSTYVFNFSTTPPPYQVTPEEEDAAYASSASYAAEALREEEEENRGKEIKRNTLLELVNYITLSQPLLIDREILSALFDLFSSNLFRSLPPSSFEINPHFNAEEDDFLLDPAWTHIQVVYELLLRVLNNYSAQLQRVAERQSNNKSHHIHTEEKENNTTHTSLPVTEDTVTEQQLRIMDTFISRRFVSNLLSLFACEDAREREYLKTIVHKIYFLYIQLRPFIRKEIYHILHQFTITDRHHGISELLELLGSIISGYAVPLKVSHLAAFSLYILPLHKSSLLSLFSSQLTYCVLQYMEKDKEAISEELVFFLCTHWPKQNSKKELVLLNEVEEILDHIHLFHLSPDALIALFRRLSLCISSPHFQVSERAIYILNNDIIVRFISSAKEKLIPLLASALFKNAPNVSPSGDSATSGVTTPSNFTLALPHSSTHALRPLGSSLAGHWNSTIVELTVDIIKLFQEIQTESGLVTSETEAQNKNIMKAVHEIVQAQLQEDHERQVKDLEEMKANEQKKVRQKEKELLGLSLEDDLDGDSDEEKSSQTSQTTPSNNTALSASARRAAWQQLLAKTERKQKRAARERRKREAEEAALRQAELVAQQEAERERLLQQHLQENSNEHEFYLGDTPREAFVNATPRM